MIRRTLPGLAFVATDDSVWLTQWKYLAIIEWYQFKFI